VSGIFRIISAWMVDRVSLQCSITFMANERQSRYRLRTLAKAKSADRMSVGLRTIADKLEGRNGSLAVEVRNIALEALGEVG
jgi:hypothetical protein